MFSIQTAMVYVASNAGSKSNIPAGWPIGCLSDLQTLFMLSILGVKSCDLGCCFCFSQMLIWNSDSDPFLNL